MNYHEINWQGDHGSRRARPGIGAIGKNYTPRERGQGNLSRLEEDSLSTTFDFMGVRGSNYGPYQSYLIPYGMQSSGNSWTQSEEQSSNDYGYGQSRAMPDPYLP